MAKTTQSVQYAAQVAAAGNFNSRINDARTIQMDVEYAFIDVATTVDNVATDVIALLEFDTDVIIIPELSFIVVTDDMSSGTVALDIGDTTDPDRYCDGAVCSAVGTVQFISAAIPDGYTNRHKTTTDTRLVSVTLATFGATVEAGAFRVVIAFKAL